MTAQKRHRRRIARDDTYTVPRTVCIESDLRELDPSCNIAHRYVALIMLP